MLHGAALAAAATGGRISAGSLEAHTWLQNMEARHDLLHGQSRKIAPSFARFAECGDVFAAFSDSCVRYSQTQGEHNETIYHLSGDCIGGSILFVARS
jgi:hypothetical protein